MMRVESEIEFHWKEDYLMNSGQIVTVEMKLIKLLDIQKREYPEDYKFNWIAFDQDNPKKKYFLIIIMAKNHTFILMTKKNSLSEHLKKKHKNYFFKKLEKSLVNF